MSNSRKSAKRFSVRNCAKTKGLSGSALPLERNCIFLKPLSSQLDVNGVRKERDDDRFHMELKVKEIMDDSAIAEDEKIEELRKLRIEARDVQRAATESSMGADDGLQDDLRIVDKALHQLGADIEEKGAATL